MMRRAGWIMASLLMTTSVRGEIPGSRPFYTLKAWSGVELIIVGVSRLNPTDETKVLVDEHGAHLNTNQEFIYMAAARDFKEFTSKALETPMVLRADTPEAASAGWHQKAICRRARIVGDRRAPNQAQQPDDRPGSSL
ncbi:MAG: hypothetical protein L0387_30625 [Acidobacteria bacterium]|nr:hypothetical protein [Acidobacteriota bacterium]MCI0721552.1 hypothetical protein [Acidobacteriota bacterium]